MSNVIKRKSGFTLIELMVVLSIIALLSALVFAALSKARAKARDGRRTADLHQVRTALEMYQDTHASYPRTASSTNLADVGGLGKVSSSTDPLSGLSYKYYGTNKSVAGENIICNAEPCTGYVLISNREIVENTTTGIAIKDMPSGSEIASTTSSGVVASNVTYTVISSGGGGGGGGGGGSPVVFGGLSGAVDSMQYFSFDIPSGFDQVKITTTGGTGDVDLYAKYNANPTLSVFDCRSWNTANEEECIKPTQPTGSWKVGLHAYEAFTGVTLTVEFINSGIPPIAATGLTGPWQQYPLPGFKEQEWVSVASGGGSYVAIGSNNTEQPLLSSTDGATWTPRNTPTSMGLHTIAYGGGKFVAINGGYQTITSTNTIDWLPGGTIPTVGWQHWGKMTYGAGQFVAVSHFGSSTNAIATSPDGVNWTIRSIPTVGGDGQSVPADWIAVTYGGGQFVAYSGASSTNQIITSADGVTWVARNVNTGGLADTVFAGITYGGGKFVVTTSNDYGDEGLALISSDSGVTWTKQVMPNRRWMRVAYGAGLFVAIETGRSATSPDGITWTERVNPVLQGSITFNGSQFVTVGWLTYNNSYKSSDGITWTTNSMITPIVWHGFAKANGKYFVYDREARVSSSVDGITWSTPSAPVSSTTIWTPIVYGNGTYVMFRKNNVNGKNLATSADGITWTLRTANMAGGVVFAAGKFVAVGSTFAVPNSGYSLTSADGINWTVNSNPAIASPVGIKYGGGKFVTIGGGKSFTSNDGVTWTEHGALPSSGMNDWDGMDYDGTRFIAAGYDTPPIVSADGVTWTALAEPGISDEEYTRGPACTTGACIVESTWGGGYAHADGVARWYSTEWTHSDPMIGTVITQLGSNAYKTMSATEGYIYISE